MSVATSDTLIIINPASAGGRTARTWSTRAHDLAGRLDCPPPVATTHAGHAISLVRDHIANGGRRIVAIGGDGTFNEVCAGCVADDGSVPEGIVLGFLHGGTGGDLLRTLGMPKDDPDAAIEVIVQDNSRPIDLGLATYTNERGERESRAFAVLANVGLGAEVVRRAEGRLKKFGQSASFGIATVRSLWGERNRTVTLTRDDDVMTLNVVDVMACNGRYAGGGMLLAPDADPSDGLFDVVVIGAAGILRLLRAFPKIYKGTHVHDPLVSVTRCASVSVEAHSPERIAIDGELVGYTPVSLRVLPRAVRMIAPVA